MSTSETRKVPSLKLRRESTHSAIWKIDDDEELDQESSDEQPLKIQKLSQQEFKEEMAEIFDQEDAEDEDDEGE